MTDSHAATTDVAPQKISTRARVQAFGGFLTAMVIPNVGAFIAWGFLTALFIPTGWLPNEHLAELVGPTIHYMLPLLLAFTGGKLIHGQRGGVIGSIATMGAIVGAGDSIHMFLGAMILGPTSAWLLKKFDELLDGKIRPGFEMLVNNFSLGIMGLLLCLASFQGVGPLIQRLSEWLMSGIEAFVETGFLPALSILNEPAKVLFLNNVIDQGMYYPLGMQEAEEAGKSIFFMVASNPGPGLGLLLAFFVFSRSRTIKNSTPGAIVIHFIGGIHEIYFPYVLMRPLTILAMIAGAASGIVTFTLFDVGLVAGPSPGSIISYLALTPRGDFIGVIAGVLVATAVSFLITGLILKLDRRTESDDDLAAQQEASSARKAEGAAVLNSALEDTTTRPRSVVFACDAGLGSSTMGAGIFRDKLAKAGITDITVSNSAIENIPDDADLVVVHQNLAERTKLARPHVHLVAITNYLNDPALDELVVVLETEESTHAR